MMLFFFQKYFTLLLWLIDGDMGGSEYCDTAKQNRTNTASPEEILSTLQHRKIYLV